MPSRVEHRIQARSWWRDTNIIPSEAYTRERGTGCKDKISGKHVKENGEKETQI